MTNDTTRFQSIVNDPQNEFDELIVAAVDEALTKEQDDLLIKIRDKFNAMTDEEYDWYKVTNCKIVSLDAIMDKISAKFIAIMKKRGEAANIPPKTLDMVSDLVLSIAPWHHEVNHTNFVLREFFGKTFVEDCKPALLLLKDCIIDKLNYKVKTVELALTSLKETDSAQEKLEIVYNPKTFMYELTEKKA
jgi:hypothetical protein